MKDDEIGAFNQHCGFHRALSAPAMSTDMIQVGFTHFPSCLLVKRLWLDITSCSCNNAQWSLGLNQSCSLAQISLKICKPCFKFLKELSEC